MKPKRSSSYLQKPATCPYPKPDRSSLCYYARSYVKMTASVKPVTQFSSDSEQLHVFL